MDRKTTTTPRKSGSPRIALALGSGGARGLAHIAVLEAIDDLGLEVSAIHGTSMGAIIGAAYAAGIPGRDLRAHTLGILRNRSDVMARVLKARVGRFADMFRGQFGNPVIIDAELLLDLFWPKSVPDRFDALKIPFAAFATDYVGRCAVRYDSGPLASAVAASMAIPGLIRPVQIDGLILIDGGVVNPLPYLDLAGLGDIVLASDVAGGSVANKRGVPAPFEAMLGAAQIMQTSITAEMLKTREPDILVRPTVGAFHILDFFRANQILSAADPCKDQIKHSIDAALAAW